MPTTPVLALPYPSATDTADVPRDIQNLAVKLDGFSSLRPPLVTSLPGSPVDGQECYYQADATAGIVWHLRYRAAATGPYKWEYIGGPAKATEIPTAQPTSGTGSGFSDLATIGPDVFVPLAGDYSYMLTAAINVASGSAFGGVGVAVGAGQPTNADIATLFTTNLVETANVFGRMLGLAAGVTLRERYLYSTVVITYSTRKLAVVPIRVG